MLSLGEYPIVSLANARQKVVEQKSLLDQNIDPTKYQVEEKERVKLQELSSFREVALGWYETKQGKRSESYRQTVQKSFERDLIPALGAKDIKPVTPYDVLKMQKDTIKRVTNQMNHGTGKSTAIRNRQIVNAIFNYAIANLLCETNPAVSLGQTVERPPKETARPMTQDEMARFYTAMKTSRNTERLRMQLCFYSIR